MPRSRAGRCCWGHVRYHFYMWCLRRVGKADTWLKLKINQASREASGI